MPEEYKEQLILKLFEKEDLNKSRKSYSPPSPSQFKSILTISGIILLISVALNDFVGFFFLRLLGWPIAILVSSSLLVTSLPRYNDLVDYNVPLYSLVFAILLLFIGYLLVGTGASLAGSITGLLGVIIVIATFIDILLIIFKASFQKHLF